MELGEKIRRARLEAGLSQRQLCGEEITRNMLSLIENGGARPSVKTLRYLADRLGKSLSWFLDEDGAQDSELLESDANLRRAAEALGAGRDIYAAQLLEKVTAPRLQREKLLIAAQLPGASPGALCGQLPSLDGELLLRARGALDAGDLDRCAGLLGAVEDRGDSRYHLISGQLRLREGSYSLAAEHLRRAEAAFPEQTVPLLELCYRELGDFKQAYAYACKQKG